MEKIDRTPPPPPLDNPEWVKASNNTAQQAQHSGRTHAWRMHNGVRVNQIILPELIGMTHDHCAFCDCRLNYGKRNSAAEIEHFRPKSQYPEHWYTWENLFPICGTCNKSKLQKFDEDLLKPDLPEYTFSRYFLFDFKSGQLIPNPLAEQNDQARASKTCEIFKLNKADLCEDRIWFYRALYRWENEDQIPPECRTVINSRPFRFIPFEIEG